MKKNDLDKIAQHYIDSVENLVICHLIEKQQITKEDLIKIVHKSLDISILQATQYFNAAMKQAERKNTIKVTNTRCYLLELKTERNKFTTKRMINLVIKALTS